jgi:hypothetical protein
VAARRTSKIEQELGKILSIFGFGVLENLRECDEFLDLIW